MEQSKAVKNGLAIRNGLIGIGDFLLGLFDVGIEVALWPECKRLTQDGKLRIIGASGVEMVFEQELSDFADNHFF